MEWKENYNVGIAIIDNQHRKLVAEIDLLQKAVTSNTITGKIALTLRFIVNYVHHHFAEEEAVMKSVGFPELDKHRDLHTNLTNEVKAIQINIKKGKPINAKELIDFLIEWLNKHILEEDLKIGSHVRKLTATGSITNKPLSSTGTKKNIIDKLVELKSIYSQELVTKSDYKHRKFHIIEDFISLQLIDSKQTLEKIFKLLYTLFEKGLTTEDNYKTYTALVFEKVNLQSLLARIKDNTEKLEFIKFLFKEGVIADKEYETNKNLLLGAKT